MGRASAHSSPSPQRESSGLAMPRMLKDRPGDRSHLGLLAGEGEGLRAILLRSPEIPTPDLFTSERQLQFTMIRLSGLPSGLWSRSCRGSPGPGRPACRYRGPPTGSYRRESGLRRYCSLASTRPQTTMSPLSSSCAAQGRILFGRAADASSGAAGPAAWSIIKAAAIIEPPSPVSPAIGCTE